MSELSKGLCPTIGRRLAVCWASSTINRRFYSPYADINTGAYQDYPVKIRDDSSIADTFKTHDYGLGLTKTAEKRGRVI